MEHGLLIETPGLGARRISHDGRTAEAQINVDSLRRH